MWIKIIDLRKYTYDYLRKKNLNSTIHILLKHEERIH